MKIHLSIFICIIIGLSCCGTAYYGAMENLGIHKREIMVDSL